MATELFRKEVAEAKKLQWLGSIRIIRPFSFSIIVTGSIFIVLSLLAFSLLGEVTRRARLTGLITPVEGTFNLVSPQEGVIIDIKVEEGEVVHKGQVLAVISTDRETNDGALTQLIARALSERRLSLETEHRLIQRQAQEREESLLARLSSLNTEKAFANAESMSVQRRINLASKTMERYRELAKKGAASDIEAQDRQEILLDLLARHDNLQRASAALSSNAVALHAELANIKTTLATQVMQIERSMATLSQESAENSARSRIPMLAPRDGQVSVIGSTIGQTVLAGRSVMMLLPRKGNRPGELEVQLFSPSRATGFAQVGQDVWIRVDAYPYQKFGMIKGVVKSVSATPIGAQDLPYGQAQALAEAAKSSEPLYRVHVGLSRQFIDAYGQQHDFKAGMSIQADIIQDRRAVWEWLLEPVLAATASMGPLFGTFTRD